MDVPRIDVVIIVLAPSLDVPRRTRRSEYTAGGGAPWPTIGRTDADRLGARPYRSKRKNRSRHKRFREGLAFLIFAILFPPDARVTGAGRIRAFDEKILKRVSPRDERGGFHDLGHDTCWRMSCHQFSYLPRQLVGLCTQAFPRSA